MPITLRELARKLNLSITTVSRALDGYPDVAAATRERVIAAAREAGYEPAYAARLMRRHRTGALGYILPGGGEQFRDPFHSAFLTGLCDRAASQGADILISSAPPDSAEEQTLYRRWVLGGRVDGMLINRLRLRDWRIQFLRGQGIPFVCLAPSPDPPAQGEELECPGVRVDDRGGMRRLTAHLLALGHRRLGYIGGPPELVLTRERLNGVREALRSAGIDPQGLLIETAALDEDSGYQAARRLLNLAEPPTALIACSDLIALGALRAVQEAGFQPGAEIAVSGYDGIPAAALAHPPLTTLEQPTYQIAGRMVEILLAHLAGKSEPPPDEIYQPRLILRASTQS